MLPNSIPGAHRHFHHVDVDSDDDVGKDDEELERQLSQIGGWWGVVARRWINLAETPGKALTEVKRALLEDTISYGVVSAVMLTIAQAEMTLDDSGMAAVFLSKTIKQFHVNCWYICFGANMLCLYLSTTEYLRTAATHPQDVLVLLSKRYPPDFGKPPECSFQSWMRYLKVGKLDAFKRGFQTMVPGLLSSVYLRCDWHLTVGPIIISLLTVLMGWAMWKAEMKPGPKKRRPTNNNRGRSSESLLEPSFNSRELRLASSGPSDFEAPARPLSYYSALVSQPDEGPCCTRPQPTCSPSASGSQEEWACSSSSRRSPRSPRSSRSGGGSGRRARRGSGGGEGSRDSRERPTQVRASTGCFASRPKRPPSGSRRGGRRERSSSSRRRFDD